MRKAIPLRQELEGSADAVLLLHDRGRITRSDVVTQAEALAQRLRELGTQRMLLRSADPACILASLMVCWEEGIDLILAHAGLADAMCAQIATDLLADTALEAMPGQLLQWRVLRAPAAPARGTMTLMTSGTTDVPKLAEHDPAALVGRILASSGVAANRGGRWLLTYQPTSFAGLQVLLTVGLTAGSLAVPAAFTPAAFVHAAALHRVTHISGTPTFWRSFLIAGAGAELGSLRQVTVGGEAVDAVTLRRLARAYPSARITQIYASTEAGALFAVHDGQPGFPASWLDTTLDGGTRLRIQAGELQVQSPRRMLRYVNRTSSFTDDGWFPTGDLVQVRGDRVYFAGRRDSIINVGGMKVFPEEVESFLLGLADIVEAKVRARPNPITGYVLIAEVVLAAGADADTVCRHALQACREGLPRHQVPAVIRAVEQITVNPSGKKA